MDNETVVYVAMQGSSAERAFEAKSDAVNFCFKQVAEVVDETGEISYWLSRLTEHQVLVLCAIKQSAVPNRESLYLEQYNTICATDNRWEIECLNLQTTGEPPCQ